jgi:hypothetical protein
LQLVVIVSSLRVVRLCHPDNPGPRQIAPQAEADTAGLADQTRGFHVARTDHVPGALQELSQHFYGVGSGVDDGDRSGLVIG